MIATLAAIPAPLIVYDEHTDQIRYANEPAQTLFALDGEQGPVCWSSLWIGEKSSGEAVPLPPLAEVKRQAQFRTLDGRTFWGVVALSSLPPTASGLRRAHTDGVETPRTVQAAPVEARYSVSTSLS